MKAYCDLTIRRLRKAALLGFAASASVQLYAQGTVNFANNTSSYVYDETSGTPVLERATNSMANATCFIWCRKQLLGVRGRGAIPSIHSERINTRACLPAGWPPTFGPERFRGQCCPGQRRRNFIAGFFTVKSPTNRVSGATASGYAGLPYGTGRLRGQAATSRRDQLAPAHRGSPRIRASMPAPHGYQALCQRVV